MKMREAHRAMAGKLFVRKIRIIDSTVIRSLLRGSSLCMNESAGIYWPSAMPLISGMLFLTPLSPLPVRTGQR